LIIDICDKDFDIEILKSVQLLYKETVKFITSNELFRVLRAINFATNIWNNLKRRLTMEG
jgi:hypothetical protein